MQIPGDLTSSALGYWVGYFRKYFIKVKRDRFHHTGVHVSQVNLQPVLCNKPCL